MSKRKLKMGLNYIKSRILKVMKNVKKYAKMNEIKQM